MQVAHEARGEANHPPRQFFLLSLNASFAAAIRSSEPVPIRHELWRIAKLDPRFALVRASKIRLSEALADLLNWLTNKAFRKFRFAYQYDAPLI
jgi:hypothetical protein